MWGQGRDYMGGGRAKTTRGGAGAQKNKSLFKKTQGKGNTWVLGSLACARKGGQAAGMSSNKEWTGERKTVSGVKTLE